MDLKIVCACAFHGFSQRLFINSNFNAANGKQINSKKLLLLVLKATSKSAVHIQKKKKQKNQKNSQFPVEG
jgi:hypothetical protein